MCDVFDDFWCEYDLDMVSVVDVCFFVELVGFLYVSFFCGWVGVMDCDVVVVEGIYCFFKLVIDVVFVYVGELFYEVVSGNGDGEIGK